MEAILLAIMVVCAIFLFFSFVLGDVFDVFDFELGGEGADAFNTRSLLIFALFFSASSYLSLTNGLPWFGSLIIGGFTGALAAVLLRRLINSIANNSGSSHWTIQEAVGKQATTTIEIEPDRLGQVSVLMKGQYATYGARSSNQEKIPVNSVVEIVSVQGGILFVKPANS